MNGNAVDAAPIRGAQHLCLSALLSVLVTAPTAASAQAANTGSAATIISAAAGVAPCSVVDASSGKAGTIPSLYATCNGASLRVGDAAQYSIASNARLGATMVVRQNPGSTEVDLVWVDGNGAVRLDQLTRELSDRLAKAGRGRSGIFAVDLTRYAVDGSVAVAAMDDVADRLSIDLSGYGRAATTAAALTPSGG